MRSSPARSWIGSRITPRSCCSKVSHIDSVTASKGLKQVDLASICYTALSPPHQVMIYANGRLEMPRATTTIDPAPTVALWGTTTVMAPSAQIRGLATTPPIVTLPLTADCDDPKLVPVMVTRSPLAAELAGLTLVINGTGTGVGVAVEGGETVYENALLLEPAATTATETVPGVTYAGIRATISEGDHTWIVAISPPMLTVPPTDDCVAPKLLPLIVMASPGLAVVGVMDEISGGTGVAVGEGVGVFDIQEI